MNRIEYASDKESLQSVIESQDDKEVQFNIPMYQRLYVWGDEQIKTLLEDILEAYQKDRGKDEKEIIYIGTVVLDEKHPEEEAPVVYDLVDGQQRFTTLWLLSLLFGGDNAMGRFTSLPFSDNTNPLRLTFSIRKEVSDFFEFLYTNIGQTQSAISKEMLYRVKDHIAESESIEESGQESYQYKDKRIDKIRNGLKVISQVLLERKDDWDEELSRFIYENVQFVTVKVPDGGDLNQLFETLNNRGEQLLQEDVVKAKLLNKLKDDEERTLYNRLWVACSAMNDYVENNLKAGGIGSKKIYDKLIEMYNDEGKLDISVFNWGNEKGRNGNSKPTLLSEILKDNFTPPNNRETDGDQKENGEDKEEEESSSDAEVQSIISFPQLLLHTLRIYDVKYNPDNIDNSDIYYPAVDEKKLIEIFQERFDGEWGEEATKNFIKLLWEVRFVFDNAVVKWVEQGGDRELILQKIEKSEEYLRRDYSYPESEARQKPLPKLQLLQRMLYHTQDPRKHNWLTSYLYKTLIEQKGEVRFKEKEFQACYDLLEGIDNLMFCSSLSGDRREQTYKLCLNSFEELVASENLSFKRYKDVLRSGLNTPHYWFYKIDLLLFNQKKEYKGAIGNWEKFKMNSRNSIEHVLPRNAKTDEVSDSTSEEDAKEIIHNWIGNLALVSTVDNATYNNGYFSEKKNKFKQINGSVPPSLKLDWMYGDKYKGGDDGLKWRVPEIKNHQKDVRVLLRDYFKKTKVKFFSY